MLKIGCLWVLVLCGAVACGGEGNASSETGGASSTSGGNGSGGNGSGGQSTGGAPSGSGGAVGVSGMVGSGGANATGGAMNANGGSVSGGAPSAGGTNAGGSVGTGGSTAAGGMGAGGRGSSGGATAAGGASTGGSASGGTGGAATGGVSSTGGSGGTTEPVCSVKVPAEFQTNTSLPGGNASVFKESPHFRVNGSASASAVDTALNHLEAAHACFVDDWCFRTTGLSVKSNTGPYYKTHINIVGSLDGAAGVMRYDAGAGLAYLEVLANQVGVPQVTVHEWGHAMTLSEYNWVDQQRTGAWWETVANWVADTYLTSTYCDAARKKFNVAAGSTIIDLNRVIGQSYLMIVSSQNLYEAWPFLTYLTSNPDNYPGLGKLALQNLFRQHARNNDTPLHVLEKVAAPVKVQTILGRYWARMAYLDIGHPKARDLFFSRRSNLNYANLDSAGNQTYSVKAARKPQYGGANIIPLTGTGEVSVQVTNLGNGLSESNFTATLAIRATSGAVRYVDLPNGAGSASVASTEEASLVVVNTPTKLYQYDAFASTASSPESIGLNYRVQITGATPK
ncbi:MAG: DUF6055 domain-containing protein [Myxococcota bacterium]